VKVRDVMSETLVTAEVDASLAMAAALMRDADVGWLPVVDEGRVVGALSDRDIVLRATAEGESPKTMPVRAVMSPGVIACRADDPVETAARLMREHRVRRLLVVEADGTPTGVVSLGDLATGGPTGDLAAGVLAEIAAAETPATPLTERVALAHGRK
jgi:CBS domain-containing protein